MLDRISLHPNRWKLTPVENSENLFDFERADEPTQIGTVLCRDTLLSAETQIGLNLGDEATVNDAFARLISLIGTVNHNYNYYVEEISDEISELKEKISALENSMQSKINESVRNAVADEITNAIGGSY